MSGPPESGPSPIQGALRPWILRQAPFSKTHDLSRLWALLPAPEDVGATPEELGDMTPHAVATRYSDEEIAVTREDAEIAVGIAGRVRDRIRSLLPPQVLGP